MQNSIHQSVRKFGGGQRRADAGSSPAHLFLDD
jgi:hypothetical protein